MTYQRNNNYAPAATYADPYRLAQYRPGDGPYGRHGPVAMDDSATRSPSIDSIQKDPRYTLTRRHVNTHTHAPAHT